MSNQEQQIAPNAHYFSLMEPELSGSQKKSLVLQTKLEQLRNRRKKGGKESNSRTSGITSKEDDRWSSNKIQSPKNSSKAERMIKSYSSHKSFKTETKIKLEKQIDYQNMDTIKRRRFFSEEGESSLQVINNKNMTIKKGKERSDSSNRRLLYGDIGDTKNIKSRIFQFGKSSSKLLYFSDKKPPNQPIRTQRILGGDSSKVRNCRAASLKKYSSPNIKTDPIEVAKNAFNSSILKRMGNKRLHKNVVERICEEGVKFGDISPLKPQEQSGFFDISMIGITEDLNSMVRRLR